MFSKNHFAILFFFANFLIFHKLNSSYHDSINHGSGNKFSLTIRNSSNSQSVINSFNSPLTLQSLSNFTSQQTSISSQNSQKNFKNIIVNEVQLNNKQLEEILSAVKNNNFSQAFALSQRYKLIGGFTLYHKLLMQEYYKYTDDPYITKNGIFEDPQIDQTLQMLAERKKTVNEIKTAYGLGDNLSREAKHALYNMIDLANGDRSLLDIKDPESLKNFQNKVKPQFLPIYCRTPKYIEDNAKLKRGVDLTKSLLFNDYATVEPIFYEATANAKNKNKDLVFLSQDVLISNQKTAEFLSKLNSNDFEFARNLALNYNKFTNHNYLNSLDSSEAKFLNREFCKTLDKISQACVENNISTNDLRIDAALKLNVLGFDYTAQAKFEKAYKVHDVLDSLINFTVEFFRKPAMGVISSIEAAGKLAYNMLDIVVQEEMDHEKLLATGFAFGFNSTEYLKECQKIYDVNKQQADQVLAGTNAALETGKIIGKAVLDHEIVNKIGLMYGFGSPEFVQAEQQFSVQNKVFNEAVKAFAEKVKNMDAGQLGGLSGELFFTFAPYGKIGKMLSPLLQESATALKNLGNVSLGKIEMIAEAVNTEKQFVVLGTAVTDELIVLSSAINETEKALPAIQKLAQQIEDILCKCPPEYLAKSRRGVHPYLAAERNILAYPAPEKIEQFSKYFGELGKDSNGVCKLTTERLKHLLELEIMCDSTKLTLSGLHYDYMGRLQKAGVLEFKNIIYGPGGCFEAIVHYKNASKRCSFFPNDISMESVLEVINESLHNITSLPTIQKNGNLLFEGSAIVKGESLNVNVVIDKFNNIVTAYPVIKK